MAPQSEEDEYGISIESKSEAPTSMIGFRQEEKSPLKDILGPESKGPMDATYKIFSAFAYGKCGFMLYFILSAIPPILEIISIYWLGLWTAYPYYVFHDKYLYCFLNTVLLALFFTIVRNIYSYFMTLCGASNLHSLMVERVLRGYS